MGDVREAWETSQNPIVYSVAGIWENLTGETEEGIAMTHIKKYDPEFLKEEWADEVRERVVPQIIKAQLDGDLKVLRKWLAEAVYQKLAADIRLRKGDGITFNSTILNLEENLVKMRYLEEVGPVIVVVYMVQQINCIKDKKGEIIEVSNLYIL